ncbi:accessory Sec system protein Asp2, partial [Staphylococcus aureus]
GRHNDDSPTIASWFVNFYNIILEDKLIWLKKGLMAQYYG